MAEGVVTIVTEGIKLLGAYIPSLSGVSYQVELAQVELHLMRGFLKDADSKIGEDEVVRIWVGLIRDVAYDLEDVIESFAVKLYFKKEGGKVKTVLKKFACIFRVADVHNIGSDIDDIKVKLSQLRSSLQSYNIRQISGSEVVASSIRRHRDRRLTYGHAVESHIVGLEENTDTLVKELVREGKRHRVVSIWGMGGSGKTTLAREVFRQDEVKRHFGCFAWVCISQQCDGKDVLEEILFKLTSPPEDRRKEISNLTSPPEDRRKEIAKMRKDEIAEELCKTQQKYRCLVILDDIWTPEAWRSIKEGFPVNVETESRILLTTRKKEVALLASGNDYLHQPQPLDGKQTWQLFENIVIGGRDRPSDWEEKKKLGRKMLDHCSGLPLAISVLAGLLSRREKYDEWEAVLRNVDNYIMRGTNVHDSENSDQDYGVRHVLALSYNDLPSQLKLCFLYLAQYPEDHEIPVKRLTHLWIAEGFIASTSAEIMEDEAYGCLIELVERCMVQVGKYGLTGKVKTCRLHDLMRDLCIQKAAEENFLQVVNFSSGRQASKPPPLGKVRRLALHFDRSGKNDQSSIKDGRYSKIRSLLYFAPEQFYPEWNKKVTIRSVFNDFKLLRVLKFENIRVEFELPKTIGNLVHLRFLSLKGSACVKLPSSLSKLVLLQTLDLRCLYRRYSFRDVFREQLRHLYLPYEYSASGEKVSLGRLHNLQTLVNISLDSCDLNELVQSTNLKKLYIYWSEPSQLEKLKNMLISASVTYAHLRSLSLTATRDSVEDIPRDLVLRCPHLYKLRLEGKMSELPEQLRGYSNLTKITLIYTHLKGDQIDILEKLPKLRVLYLGNESIESETLIFSQGGFPHLELLTLCTLTHLKEWRVEKEAMPCLHSLRIVWCPELRAIPDGLQDVTTLKELTIFDMPSTFCRRVGEGGEDFYKIKHVPSLIITNHLAV